jgi:hypothetical protein
MAKKKRVRKPPPPVNRYGTPDQQDRTRGAYPNRPGRITEDDPRYVPRGKPKHKPKGPLEYKTPYQQHT